MVYLLKMVELSMAMLNNQMENNQLLLVYNRYNPHLTIVITCYNML